LNDLKNKTIEISANISNISFFHILFYPGNEAHGIADFPLNPDYSSGIVMKEISARESGALFDFDSE